MIAKAIKGKNFRGALEYDLKKEQGRIIDTNRKQGVRSRKETSLNYFDLGRSQQIF